MKTQNSKFSLSINVLSFNEHDLLINAFDKYHILSTFYRLSFNLNLLASDIQNTDPLLKIISLIKRSNSSIEFNVRFFNFKMVINSIDDINYLKNVVHTRNLSLSEHLSSISDESNENGFIWFLGAGDFPNNHCINILDSHDINNFDIISFEIHHSVAIPHTESSNKIKIRRVEALSSTIYRQSIFKMKNFADNFWPHLLMLCKQEFTLKHLLISYKQSLCCVYVHPTNNWQDDRKIIEKERILLALEFPSNNIIEWEFSNYDIEHALTNLDFINNRAVCTLLANSKKLPSSN